MIQITEKCFSVPCAKLSTVREKSKFVDNFLSYFVNKL